MKTFLIGEEYGRLQENNHISSPDYRSLDAEYLEVLRSLRVYRCVPEVRASSRSIRWVGGCDERSCVQLTV